MREVISFVGRVPYYFLRQRRWWRKSWNGFPKESALVREVGEHGFAVVEGFKSAEWCENTLAQVWSAPRDAITETDEDRRIFGCEKLSPLAAEFASDPSLLQIASMYAGNDEALLFCMANHVTFREGGFGSGGEWHRDSFRREIKALIYLRDVTEANGPFAYVERSHRRIFSHSLKIASRMVRGERGFGATRLKDAGTRFGARKFTAKAGTLILFDTCGIHTGVPLRQGERFALTNYYVAPESIEAHKAYYRDKVRLL